MFVICCRSIIFERYNKGCTTLVDNSVVLVVTGWTLITKCFQIEKMRIVCTVAPGGILIVREVSPDY